MFPKCVMVFLFFAVVKSVKILVVVPTPSLSHQVIFRPLIGELIKHNYEVTVITADPEYPRGKSPKNLIEIDVHNSSYMLWNKMLNTLPSLDERDVLFEMKLVFRELSRVFEVQLKNPYVQDIIKNKAMKFDLLILEACINPALIFSYIFKAPVIQMSSLGAIPGNMEMIGAVTHPNLYPTHYRQKLYNLTIWEKIFGVWDYVAFKNMLEQQESEDNIMLQSFFENDIPPLSQLKNNVHMLFLNIHPIWVHNQPVPSNVIYTWGIHKPREKLISKELQSYLDSSKNGVIYISFGTNVKCSSIPSTKLEILVKVLSQLPYNILWKWDLDELPGKSENIYISKWFPQVDILRHPNLKLFITQGGLQSTEEAINAGVPLIGIPLFTDQSYNAEKYTYFKIGINLDFKSLTLKSFQNAITNIFTDYESYRKNIIHLRTLMQDYPKPPLENAIWWIEYVLRHNGAKHLRAPSANMTWAEYYELEIVFIVLSGFIVFGYLLLIVMYSFCKFLSRTVIEFNSKKTKIF